MSRQNFFLCRKLRIIFLFFFLLSNLLFNLPLILGDSQDFTSYTEVDPNNHITIYNTTTYKHHIVENEDCYLFCSNGDEYFFYGEHHVDAKIENISSNPDAYVMMLSSNIDDRKGLVDNYENYTCIKFNVNLGYIQLEKCISHSITVDSYLTTISDKWWYFTFIWDASSIKLYIYNNTARTADYLEDTLSLTTISTKFRYIIASNTRNRGDAANCDLTIKNLILSATGNPQADNIGVSPWHQANTEVTFHANWTADPNKIGYKVNMSYWVFGNNHTGIFQNSSTYTFSSSTNWSNYTLTLPCQIGNKVSFQFWANNTNNLWNTTGLQVIEVVGVNFTFYHNLDGYILVDAGCSYSSYFIPVNATTYSFANDTTINLFGSPENSSYYWLNFTWDSDSSTDNYANVSVALEMEGYDFWCYFDVISSDAAGLAELAFILAIVAIALVIIWKR